MKRYAIGIILVTVCASALAQTTKPAALADLQSFVGGEWKTEAKWANGNAFKAVARFESMLGGKYVCGESFVVDDAGNLTPRDVVVFSQANDQLIQHVFNADGNTRTATGSMQDGVLVFEWNRANADGTLTPLKQRIRKIDENTSNQQFLMFIRGEWHTLLDSTWHRQPVKP